MTVPGMIAVVVLVVFSAVCAVRMVPVYFEYLSVRDIVSRTAVDPEVERESPARIRARLDTIFHTNQINGLKSRDVEIYRREGKTYIDAGYEVRVPLIGRVDAVLNFHDLLYVVGDGEPIAGDDR